jgi:hypothetical protein
MFDGWTNFYMLLGTASAGLIGLLFVVSTLTSSIDPSKRSRGLGLFLTPTVFKFGAVLALSAIALAPGLPAPASRALVAVVGLVGLANLAAVTLGLVRGEWNEPLHWSDPWCYGVVPALAFGGLAVFAAVPDGVLAARGAAALALVVLLLAARNAWDLVTALSARKADHEHALRKDP